MSSGRGKDIEGGAHDADKSALIDPSKLEGESKSAFLKRVAMENRKQKAGNKIADEWFEVSAGKKLVKKIKKANGGVYSIYVGNIKKNKETNEFMRLLEKGSDGKLRRKISKSKKVEAEA